MPSSAPASNVPLTRAMWRTLCPARPSAAVGPPDTPATNNPSLVPNNRDMAWLLLRSGSHPPAPSPVATGEGERRDLRWMNNSRVLPHAGTDGCDPDGLGVG